MRTAVQHFFKPGWSTTQPRTKIRMQFRRKRKLKPAFKPDGQLTHGFARNGSSQIKDAGGGSYDPAICVARLNRAACAGADCASRVTRKIVISSCCPKLQASSTICSIVG